MRLSHGYILPNDDKIPMIMIKQYRITGNDFVESLQMYVNLEGYEIQELTYQYTVIER